MTDGYATLLNSIIKNTFQALEHPKIVGRDTIKLQQIWYKNLISWASKESELMTLWGDIFRVDELKARKKMVRIAKKKLKLLKTSEKPL